MDNTILGQIVAYLALYWPVGVALLGGVVTASVLWQMRLQKRLREVLEQELQQAKIALESRSQQVADYRVNQAALEVRLEETAKAFAEKEALF